MAERYREVMRRKDAPHIFFGANPVLRTHTDVLELAWLDTETGKTLDYDAKPLDKPAKKPTVRRPKKPEPKPAPAELDELDALADLDIDLS